LLLAMDAKLKKMDNAMTMLAMKTSSDAGTVQQVEETLKPFQDLSCPPLSNKQKQNLFKQAKVINKEIDIEKYYEHSNNKACDKGMWNLIGNEQHRKITKHLISIMGAKKGDCVYDWGSGCGDSLGWMHEDGI